MDPKKIAKIAFILVYIYLIINFFLVFLLNPYHIRNLFIFHWLVILAIFIVSMVNLSKNKKRSNILKKMDSSSKTGYLLANYTQNAGHILFCYFGFFFLYCLLYLSYAYFRKIKINPGLVISTFVVGAILAFKETILQFSQCITARLIQKGFGIPKCDQYYYKFWNCVQNKSYNISAEEE